jgi:hypothetical protein
MIVVATLLAGLEPRAAHGEPASEIAREASGVAVLGKGRTLVVASDEEKDKLFRLSPDDPATAWPLRSPTTSMRACRCGSSRSRSSDARTTLGDRP